MAASSSDSPQASPVAALIFDCDGTILNSMEWYWPSWVATCGRWGIGITKKRFYELAGVPVRGMFEALVTEQGLGERIGPSEISQIVEEKRRHVAAMRSTTPVGLIECVVKIVRDHHGKLPMAVASSGHREDVHRGLKEHGLFDLFDVVVCNEDNAAAGNAPKPAPDIFLLAAERLGVDPSRCRGYEDADVGMAALRAAGMDAVDVREFKGHPAAAALHDTSEDGAPSGAGLDASDALGDVVRITQDVLSCDTMVALVTSPGSGAVATFVGTTRDNFEGRRVLRLEYEAYEAMALKEMLKVCARSRGKWPGLTRMAIVHRLGVVPIGEASVIIAVSSPHRRDALEAVHFAIDDLKRTVPVWKREVYGDALGQEAGTCWKENKEWSLPGGPGFVKRADEGSHEATAC